MIDYDDIGEPKKVDNLKLLIGMIKDTNDLYYLSLMILSSKIGKGSILPELVFLLNEEYLNKLLYYYGGQTITIPSLSDFRDYLYGILIYYYCDIKGHSWKKSIELMGLEYSGDLSRKLTKLRREVIEGLQDIKIPESKSGNTM